MKQLLSVLLFAAAAQLFAHDVITTNLSYTRDISRIFARRCVSCHATGSSIPLTSYEEVRPWAVDIKEQVLSRAMPPWGAVKGFGDLAPDPGLTQEEILIISAWVVGGAPQGDAALLPKPQNAAPAKDGPALSDSITVVGTTKLTKPLRAYGVKPIPESTVLSSRITAKLPDGRIQPLVWLYQYDPKLHTVFRFREPVDLPAGTVVQASTPVKYVLETGSQSDFTGIVKTTVFTTPAR